MQSSALLLEEEPIERSKCQLVHFAAAATATIFCESHHEIRSTLTEPGYSSLQEVRKEDKLTLPDNDSESQTDDMDGNRQTTFCCKIGSTSTQWHAILYGQLLSVALTVSSATSLALNSKTSSSSSDSSSATNPIISTTPTFSLLCMYLLLALIHFTYWLYCQRQERQQAITALILSNLTSAVDCTLDEAYHTLADKRHSSTIVPNCNSNSNKNSATNDQDSVMMMIVEPAANSPQTIDMELDLLERHFFPVSRYKFLQVLCCSSAPLNLHSYSWKQYCGLALIHVQGNYCLLKSFQYESFKTVILLQSISIPAAMITSAIFLRRHYTCLHILGAILCIFGSALTFRDAFFSSGSSRGSNITTTTSTTTDLFPNPIIGDLLAVSSAILSGSSDVFAEQAVKYNGSIIE
jgi:drug/metabolite transporter (DMT)-like permease